MENNINLDAHSSLITPSDVTDTPPIPSLKHEDCFVVAKDHQVYSNQGKFLFSISMTDEAIRLSDNDGWNKGKESWLDYRKRTEANRQAQKDAQQKFTSLISECINAAYEANKEIFHDYFNINE